MNKSFSSQHQNSHFLLANDVQKSLYIKILNCHDNKGSKYFSIHYGQTFNLNGLILNWWNKGISWKISFLQESPKWEHILETLLALQSNFPCKTISGITARCSNPGGQLIGTKSGDGGCIHSLGQMSLVTSM